MTQRSGEVGVIVELANGTGSVRGRERDGVTRFLGIPYAAPPVGDLRFAEPQPVTPWSGVRDADEYGPWAPQPPETPGTPLPRAVVVGDDYLTVNVWTPDVDGRAPVMVFIHGGSFITGSGALPTYDGTAFARDGVVLVTINYRLGIEGFLWTGEGVPNRGLLDQIAALEWVRDSIGAFGGDPHNVTVFGESSGAMSVVTLMTMPGATGLFHRAIAQSGAGEHVIDEEAALLVAQKLAERLGVAPTLEAISQVPQAEALAAVGELSAAVGARPFGRIWGDTARTLLPFAPFADGTVVPALPRDRILAGDGADIELLIGTNADEANLFFVPTGAIDKLPRVLAWVFARRYGGRALKTGSSYRRRRGIRGAGELVTAVLTDGFYRVPALRIAQAMSAAHVYEFDWKSPGYDGRLGACHALELPFVFDTLGAGDLSALLGEDPPQEIADRLHAAWVAFARTGDPGWARYAESRTSHRFGLDPSDDLPDDSVDPAVWPAIRA